MIPSPWKLQRDGIMIGAVWIFESSAQPLHGPQKEPRRSCGRAQFFTVSARLVVWVTDPPVAVTVTV
jgi:hypothetical protein